MLTLSLPEVFTLTLYVVMVSLLLTALAARHERAQQLSAAVSLLFSVLASASLYFCMTGRADRWLDVEPSTAQSSATPKKKNAKSAGEAGSGGGVVVEKAKSGGGNSGADATTEVGSSPEPIDVADASPLGLVRASFNLGRSPIPTAKPFRDCSICPEMVVVPSGYAPFGSDDSDSMAAASEKPQRFVRIAKPFAIGRYEITKAEFDAFLAASGQQVSACADTPSLGARVPAQCMSWQQANGYVTWLSAKTDKKYRLPASSEWEYAARARTGTPYASGVALREGDANIGDDASHVRTVGAFKPNEFGLSDMTGNVAELVADCWLDDLRVAPTDGSSAFRAADCRKRTLRDAAWFEPARFARSAARRPISPETALKGVGFRVVRDLR